MEMVPITIKSERERLGPRRPRWRPAVCQLPVGQKPQGARSQLGWARLAGGWEGWGPVVLKLFLSPGLEGSQQEWLFHIKPSILGKCHSPSLSKADS